MSNIAISPQISLKLEEFIRKVCNLYQADVVSIILYGSASSGEFIEDRSNVNLLIVLDNATIANCSKIEPVINSKRYKEFEPIFFSKEDLLSSTDVFPIEFLDMRENYKVLFGEDVLKDLNIDLKNLRFQCEHELKSKLILMRQAYIKLNQNKAALESMLLKSFTSVMHLTRNVLKLKNKNPKYPKSEFLTQLVEDLQIRQEEWEKILKLKNNQIKVNREELLALYINFVSDLERIASFVDKA